MNTKNTFCGKHVELLDLQAGNKIPLCSKWLIFVLYVYSNEYKFWGLSGTF
jgi:hypothetical protein